MGNPQQYYPLPQEDLATGLIGILLYFMIIYFSISSMVLGFRSKSTKRFFASVMIMSVLELPRFFSLAVDRSYSSKTTYCFHLVAGIFFFLAFSIVCRQWSGLLQLGSYFRVVYGYHGLVISNVIFGIIDIISVGICASMHSLEEFFDSSAFEVITLIEAFRNCVYSAFLAYYGLKLVKRFWHFSKLEKQSVKKLSPHAAASSFQWNWQGFKSIFFGIENSSHHPIATSFEQPPSGPATTSATAQFPVFDLVFTKVVLRLTFVLTLTTICFLFRLSMLTLKMVALHSPETYTTPDFSLFGLLWFTCSDFIPRVLPSFAFIFLMRTKKPHKDHEAGQSASELRSQRQRKNKKKGARSSSASDSDGKGLFQFVVFSSEEDARDFGYAEADGEDEDEVSNPMTGSRGGSLHEKTKGILAADQFLPDDSDDYYYYDPNRAGGGGGLNPNHSFSENLNKTSSFPKFVIDEEEGGHQQHSLSAHDERDRRMMVSPHDRQDFLQDGLAIDEDDDDDDDDDEDGMDPGEAAIDTIFSLLSLSSARQQQKQQH
jgi:hypothetical protein